MARKTQEIFKAAVALPELQRRCLIQQLLATLPDPEETWEQELEAELDRRFEEIDKGISQPIPWSELEKKLRPRA